MRRAPLLAALAALAVAAPAAAQLPVLPSGSVVGEGVPLKAYASLTPTVHLFGDVLTARLAVVADTKWVDPARLRVRAAFAPYQETRPPTVLRAASGRFQQITWTWTLRCVTSPCVPRVPPSDTLHVFRFHPAQIEYLDLRGRPAYAIRANWPPVEAISQISPGVVAALEKTNRLNWRFHLAPVASPTYRLSPGLLFWLALGLGGVLFAGAGVLGRRWYRVLRPARAAAVTAPEAATTLERAIAVLRWAHEHGDETLQRKAFERVADELTVEEADELLRQARELAWSPRTPEDVEVEAFAEQARDTALHDPAEEPQR